MARRSWNEMVSLVVVVTAAKLFFSYHVYGTNDITYWMHFAKVIKESGTFEIYRLVEIYNHPPLVSWFLKAMPWFMSTTHLGFPFLFRLLPISADVGSFFILWKLLRLYNIKNSKFVFTMCVISPVHFLISGFHGNTDPAFLFLLWLAVYFYETKRFAFAGLAYGLSLCVKIVPILALPVFLLRARSRKESLGFLVPACVVPLSVFLPYLVHDPQSLVKNIFGYGGLQGIWGLGRIFKNTSPMLYEWHIVYGVGVYFIVLVGLIYLLKMRKTRLIEGMFLAFGLFLAITPGFGVQYLSWVCFWAIVVAPVLGTLYSFCAGIFLYRVYTFWSGGFPMNDANSEVVGQWVGFDRALDLVVWGIVLVMLAKYIFTRAKARQNYV